MAGEIFQKIGKWDKNLITTRRSSLEQKAITIELELFGPPTIAVKPPPYLCHFLIKPNTRLNEFANRVIASDWSTRTVS